MTYVNIGGIQISGKVFAAPMAGVTDGVYRQILTEYGAALTYTEMVSAKGLVMANDGTRNLLAIHTPDQPATVQLFGRDPAIMAEAAGLIRETAFRIIDINCGCPAVKIVKNGEGAALMREPALIGKIVKAVARAVNGLPVTVKLRKGFDIADNTAVQAAMIAEAAGAAAVCVHGRTRNQMYSGTADWDVIRDVKTNITVPVIGNGDINSPQSAARMIDETGCDAVMIGRGAWGNPWLIKRCHIYIETGVLTPEPTACEKIGLALRHLHMLTGEKGQYTGIREMRRHLHMYTKGITGASQARIRINSAETADEIEEVLKGLVTALR